MNLQRRLLVTLLASATSFVPLSDAITSSVASSPIFLCRSGSLANSFAV